MSNKEQLARAGFAELERRGFRAGASDLGIDDLAAVFHAMQAVVDPNATIAYQVVNEHGQKKVVPPGCETVERARERGHEMRALGYVTGKFGPALVQRDQDGWWDHPGVPDFDEDAGAYKAWIQDNNLVLSQWHMEAELDESHHYWAEESCSCTGWNPQSPGPEWFLLGIFDTEDGPCCTWARVKAEGEPEQASLT